MEMCNAFSKNGFNTSLYVPKFNLSKKYLFEYYGIKNPFEIIEVDIPEIFLHGRLHGRGLIFALKVSKRLSKIENCVIYSRNSWVFFILSVLYKRYCFFEAHQFRYENWLQTRIYRLLVKTGINKGNGHIIFISRILMKQWQKAGIYSRNISVAHDAVNVDKFHNVISKDEARKRLGIDPHQIIVLYTGSLISGKGVDVLIKCANRLKNTIFIIVGGSKEEVRGLSKLARFNNVKFTGYVQPKKVPIYQSAADILALPNTKGSDIDDVTSPMKLFEYIASERPIVATEIPSILEILKNNYNALISPTGDDYSLSKNIEVLVNSPSLSELLVKNAKKELLKYSWDARVQNISKLFYNLDKRQRE
jgi:glycosyltransferase involved in cell wall biosynthesis